MATEIPNIVDGEVKLKMRAAYAAALKSTDTSTKNGALLCRDGWNVAEGFNCHVPGFGDRTEHHNRPFKYYVTEHAERAVLFNAAYRNVPVEGTTMVAPWVACPDCARAIALMGVRCVVCHKECMIRTPDRWRELVATGLLILKHSGVEVIQWSGHVGNIHNLNNGEAWSP